MQKTDIRIWAAEEDKDEIESRIERDKEIKRYLLLCDGGSQVETEKIIKAPLRLEIIRGLIKALRIIYDFLKERKDKKIEVEISLPDGRRLFVNAKNPDKLQVFIKKLDEEK